MSELKPCPFCGETKVEITHNGDEYTNPYYQCQSCLTYGGVVERGDDPFKAWNTRPLEDALRAEVERLRVQLSEADGINGDRIAAYRDRVRTLEADVERLTKERDELREEVKRCKEFMRAIDVETVSYGSAIDVTPDAAQKGGHDGAA